MKSKATHTLRGLLGLALGLALMAVNIMAQQPPPSPKKSPDAKTTDSKSSADAVPEVGEDAGDYTIISSMEFGYRGLRVDGNLNKYRSDLNYKAGPRVFDSSFLMRGKEGRDGGLFDELLVNSTGWGADPYGNLRISVEKHKWYRFDASYRTFKYFNFLNDLANPNFSTQPTNPVTGEHGYNVRQKLGDFDLTILPKNERIRFIVGYSPERYEGPAFTTYHFGGDDFTFLSQLKSRADNFRIGADAKLGPIDISFLQGFRHFRDDSFINSTGQNLGANPALNNFFLTNFQRNQPVRGDVYFTRFSAHTFLAKKLDMTARLIYTSSTTNVGFTESSAGVNVNTRITGAINPPNILNLGQSNLTGNTKRPYTLGDFGMTYLATDKLRISDTFRVENFQISGGDVYSVAFFLARSNGTAVAPLIINNGGLGYNALEVTKYRKYQNTVEADYQFNDRYSVHFGYRYGHRHIQEFLNGFHINQTPPTPVLPSEAFDEETNHTNVFIAGFKARPVKNWTIYFDAEHGTADNVFTRVGNYDYTNLRARSRYAPNRKVSFNLSLITKDNSNPSEIGGVSLADFGVNIKSRIFNSSVDWTVNPKFSISTGYTFNRQTSDAIVNYFYNSVQHPTGHSLYFMRDNFFFFDATAQLAPRVSFYAAYRINKDTGQGNRLADPTGTPGFLVTSYPMSYQSPEARLTVKLNNRLDWNIGYQYYNYRESQLISIRPQNYHAHLPYTSLRIYFGRGKG